MFNNETMFFRLHRTQISTTAVSLKIFCFVNFLLTNIPLLDQGGGLENRGGWNESSPSQLPYIKPVNTPTGRR